jgi:DNA polymerase I-like protein with 3'-5' exonuclease and polymerase domains
MIFKNGGVYVLNPKDLPKLAGASMIFLDYETTSGHPKRVSYNPFHCCGVAGFAITVDDNPTSWYIDYMRMSYDDQRIVQAWLQEVYDGCEYWINQNVKYDMHVAASTRSTFKQTRSDSGKTILEAWVNKDFPPPLPMAMKLRREVRHVCTLTMAKIENSDRLNNQLDALTKEYLGVDILPWYNALQPYLGKKNKDYGRIPGDVLGEYACQDVISGRDLYNAIAALIPEECYEVWGTEISVTWECFQTEQNGMPIRLAELQMEQAKSIMTMVKLEEELEAEVGWAFNPTQADDCYQVLCNHYGLPIVKYTTDDDGNPTTNPSFDKYALAAYEQRPDAPKTVVNRIQKYRTHNQRNNLFLKPWQELAIDEIMNCTYNQLVRTGRMACSEPNAQQLNEWAKELVHPLPGWGFISMDYSQIEFRFIAHYLDDQRIIQAYIDDPDTDFHVWVAKLCGIKRKPAKTVNFGIAFGEGKKLLKSQLAANEDIIEWAMEIVRERETPEEDVMRVFSDLVEERTEDIYTSYYARLPNLRPTIKMAERAVRQRGYIKNWSGRRRRLPKKFAHKGFNTANQASAADLIKERWVALMSHAEGLPIKTVAIVHDELLLMVPLDILHDPQLHTDLLAIMESPARPIKVPIRCSLGVSAESWKGAGADSDRKKGNKEDFESGKAKEFIPPYRRQLEGMEPKNFSWMRT